MAQLSVEIRHFSSKRTNGTQEDNVRTCSPPAGAAAGRKRRNRGPKSVARSRARATKHRAVVSAARKSKSETLLTGDARDAENIPATQENPSTDKAASVSLSAVTGKEDVSVVTTDDLTSQLEPHAANESSAFSRNLKVLQSPVESEGRRMIMTVGRSSRTPSFGQLDGLGREGDEQEKQEGQEQEEKKEEVKEREEEEEKTVEKTDEEGAHEAAYVDQGDQGDGWIPVSPRRRKQNAQVTGDDHWAGPGHPVGKPQIGSRCEHCHQSVNDDTYRLYPTSCRECWRITLQHNTHWSYRNQIIDNIPDEYLIPGFKYRLW